MKRQRIISIEAKDVSIGFDEAADDLIHKVNLKIPIGKNLAIEGASGSGKSLFLKVLAGLIEPASGEVYYNNQAIREMSFDEFIPMRLSTSVCFENGGLLMNRTLLDNIQLTLMYHDQWRKDRSPELLKKLTEHFQIQKFLHLRPGNVSSGVRKMAGLVKTFLCNAQVIFLDEPTTGIGEKGVEAFKYWLDQLILTRKPDESIILCSGDRLFLEEFSCQRFEIRDSSLYPSQFQEVA